MALIQCDFASNCLKRSVEFNIYLPGDKALPGMGPKYPLKTLYMLHGYTGCCSDWFFDSELGALSELHGLAIVMPNAENHFYVDDTLRATCTGNSSAMSWWTSREGYSPSPTNGTTPSSAASPWAATAPCETA
jgi:hypothetical protein